MAKQRHFRTPEQVAFADLIKESGLKPAEIARRMEITPASISRVLSGKQNPSPMSLASLRRVVEDARLGVAPDSNSVTRPAQMHDSSKPGLPIMQPTDDGDFLKTRGELRWVPVVSFARAGGDTFDYEDLGTHFDDWVPTDTKDPNAFALIVENDSMETRYSAGDILVVSPNDEPRNGDLVVARLAASGGVLFKLYHQIGQDKVRLTSYNKDMYPPLEYHRREFRFIYPIVNVIDRTRGRQR